MGTFFRTWSVISEIALRNLVASRWRTAILGGIAGFGALIVVLGTTLLNAVDHAMRRSITGSIAGDIQVYSAKSKEDVQIMGTSSFEAANLAPLDDFAKLRGVLTSIPNVAAVVPMGISSGIVTFGSLVDQAVLNLRRSADARARGDSSAELARRYRAQKDHVRQIIEVLRRDLENAKRVSKRARGDEMAAVSQAASDEFWSSFDRDPFEHLEFLDNRVATLATDSNNAVVRYVGTDPVVFAKAFDRMEIVDGQPIPPGQRGFMFSKFVYEEVIKLKTVRGLDKLKVAIYARHAKIADDVDLQRLVSANKGGIRELLLQLDAIKTESFRGKLQAFLHARESDVGKLLAQFFDMDDANFPDRYRFFYAALAPELDLYRARVGDVITIKTVTHGGYVHSANLKLYGTYSFKGLEQSPQAGLTNMMDLVSFRELYGFSSLDAEHEHEALRTAAGAKEVPRASAEAELFGSKPTSYAFTHPDVEQPNNLFPELSGTRRRQEQAERASYDPDQLESGVVLNAAIMLKDEAALAPTLRAIERAGARAGLPLKAAAWQQAAGVIGQFATLMRVVLYTAMLIIFIVALVVINNALVMATLERVRDIGTLRAIGAQRSFIVTMLVLESIAIGALAGAIGAMVGGAVLVALSHTGIPATSETLTFFFSGPKLFPTVSSRELCFALLTVLTVSVVSGVYPAWLAMRVSPREAMQAEE